MFIGSRMPIMSAKGEISMDKFLKSFYNDHFANRENNNIGDTEEYKKRSERHEQILKQIYIHLSVVLPANESIGLLNDYDDAMFHHMALYQYEDFKYSFFTSIQLGITIASGENYDIAAKQIMNLLQQIKEDNS